MTFEQGNLDEGLQIASDAAKKLHELEDAEQETLARILVAKILIRQNKMDQSQTEVDIVRNLSCKDRTALLATDIVAAQLLALKNAAEAVRRLVQVSDRAKTMDYVLGSMQAKLAIAEIQVSTGDRDRASRELQLLNDQAARLGFKLLKRKAEEVSNRKLGS